MSFKNKISAFLLTLMVSVVCFILPTGAVSEKENAADEFYNYNEKLLCISHRGDTENYPENSLLAVKSALKKGADFVSVSLDKTSDGIFYLCERESLGNVCNAPYENLAQISSVEVDNFKVFDVFGNVTSYSLTSLSTLLKGTDSKDGIILDVLSEDKDAVYNVLAEEKALDRIIIRVKEPAKKLASWVKSKGEKLNVISVYDGNIIFSSISSMNNAVKSGMSAVQYESKNYFNVAFGSFFTNRYLTKENARAVASTYSPDLCGQRGDSSDGWNELIKKGYSVIETNNVEAFVAYREEIKRLEKSIFQLSEKALEVDSDKYSEVSLANLKKAKENADVLAYEDLVISLDELQQIYSQLSLALKQMKISTGEVDTKGALNVTPGKCIATVIVGAALLSGQIYVYKMRKKNKEK